MKKEKTLAICNYVAAALMLVMVVVLFLPYWGSVSVQSFIWMPAEQKDLMKTVTAQIPDFDMNDIALLPFVIMVGGVYGAYKCITDPKNAWSALLPLVCGVCGIVSLLGHPVYQMGEGLIRNLVPAILTVLASVFPVTQIIPQITKNFTE